MTLRCIFLTFNKKNDKQKYLVPLFCIHGQSVFSLPFCNEECFFRFSDLFNPKGASGHSSCRSLCRVCWNNNLFLKRLYRKRSLGAFPPFRRDMMMSGGGICEQRAREAFAFGDSEKKRTFSSERDKNLITFLSAFIERRNESFLVI